MPDLPTASYNVWVRGYGLVDSPKVKAAPGKTLNLTAVPAPQRASGGRILSGAVLALAASAAAQERLPRHRPNRQRNFSEHQEPGRVDSQRRQHRRLHGLPSMGNKATREIPASLGTFENSAPRGIAAFSPDRLAAA